jgi:ATP-dependent DNA helicase PIF1
MSCAPVFKRARLSHNSPDSWIPTTPKTYKIKLTRHQWNSLGDEQKVAFVVIVIFKLNAFITGPGGVGKSFLIKLLLQCFDKSKTAITASTGIAAVNIGGNTIHSTTGIQLGEGTAEELVLKMRPDAKKRWLKIQWLIIDEISMISGDLLEKLNKIGQIIRKKPFLPFGGIQVIVFGDGLQLVPIHGELAFAHPCWKNLFEVEILLHRIFRQQNDQTFMNLLNELRMGRLSEEHEALLKARIGAKLPDLHGIQPTKLRSRRDEVSSENKLMLDRITYSPIVFKSVDGGKVPAALESLRKNCLATELVTLKKGAQVMLLKNIDLDAGLCNGSRGCILDFVRVPSVNDHNNNNVYENVGISETTTYPSSSSSSSSSSSNNKAHVYGYMENDNFQNKWAFLPRVQFENGVIRIIEAEEWKMELFGDVLARRVQIPLTLAWALTIHKSQSTTMLQGDIDTKSIFEKGQFYVALSRITSLEGVSLHSFDKSAIQVDEDAVEYYEKLEMRTHGMVEKVLSNVIVQCIDDDDHAIA